MDTDEYKKRLKKMHNDDSQQGFNDFMFNDNMLDNFKKSIN